MTKAWGGVGSHRKCVSGQDKKVKDRALIFVRVTRERGTSEGDRQGSAKWGRTGYWKPEEGRMSNRHLVMGVTCC